MTEQVEEPQDLSVIVNNLFKLEQTWNGLTPIQRRGHIEEFQQKVQELEKTSPHEPDIGHFFGDGTYGREAIMPKGVVMVGEIYKQPQINVLLKGTVLVATEQKLGVMKGPMVFVSDAGTKKAGYVIEDMHWITIMKRDNNSINPEEILANHITKDYKGE